MLRVILSLDLTTVYVWYVLFSKDLSFERREDFTLGVDFLAKRHYIWVTFIEPFEV